MQKMDLFAIFPMRKVGKYLQTTQSINVSSILVYMCCDNGCNHFPPGNFYLSYVDPVIIGRQAFHSTNDLMRGVVATFKDTLCAIVDAALNTISDVNKGAYSIFNTCDRGICMSSLLYSQQITR